MSIKHSITKKLEWVTAALQRNLNDKTKFTHNFTYIVLL